MKTKKLLALLLAGAMSASLLAGCGGNSNTDTTSTDDTASTTEESDFQYIQNKGTLIVGITNFAPMDYPDENGDWIGFDADMAKAFAEEMGVDVEFIEINWDNKISELESKAIDAVWNGMTLTDEVTSSMSCSDPYCVNAQVVVVPSDVADQYQDADSLKDLNFAVESGSAGEEMAQTLGLNYTAVQTQANALMEVSSGASDACVIDLLMAGAMIGEVLWRRLPQGLGHGRVLQQLLCCDVRSRQGAGNRADLWCTGVSCRAPGSCRQRGRRCCR